MVANLSTLPNPEVPQLPGYGELVPGCASDVCDIRAIMQQASDFKLVQGDISWGDEPFTDEEVAKMIEAEDMFVYKVRDVIAASVLLTENDERMWGLGEGADNSALYVHKLCVSNAFRDKGVGKDVMNMVELQALNNNKTMLRLDCPNNNKTLCNYYEQLGFSKARIYDSLPSAGRRNPSKDVYRAALYQKNLVKQAN